MARRGFRIHSSARFNPFSYQELIAPLQEYEQAYGQMQDAMLTLGEEANQYKQLVDTDEYASGVLKGYNDALAEMSGTLSSQGLKSVNRNSLIGLRRRYNNEVKPVNDAAKTLAGLQDMYRQAYAKDPTMMRGAMPSIKGLIEDPGAMPHMVSGTSLYNQGAQAAKNASGRKYEYSAKVNDLVRGYIRTVEKSGYDSAEAQQFLDVASRQPELQAIVSQIYGANGVDQLTNPQQGMDWIVRGVFDGLAYNEKNDLKFDQYAAEMRAAARASAKGASENTTNSYINRRTVTAQKPLTREAKQIERFKDYFDIDENAGTIRLNDKGKRAMEGSGGLGVKYGDINKMDLPSDFTRFLKNIGGTGGNGDAYKQAEEAFSRYYGQHAGELTNATQFKEYDFNLSGTENKVIENFLKTSEGKLHIAKRNNDGSIVIDRDRKPGKVTDSSNFMVNGVFIHPDGNLYAKTTSGIILLPTINEVAQNNLKATRTNISQEEDVLTDYVSNVYERYGQEFGIPQDLLSNESISGAAAILNAVGYTNAANRLITDYRDYCNDLDSMSHYVADMVRTLGAKETQF